MSESSSAFLDACNLREPEYTPVWFMRQAGRYLPVYRRLKGGRNVLELAKNPELSSQVVVDAVEALGVDAGILFADIMLPLEAMGVSFKIEENVGPVISNPIRGLDDAEALRKVSPESDLPYVYDGIDATIAKLDGRVPLIGFSGAPFTLAAYMIEGGPNRELAKTKSMMYSQPELWEALMRRLTTMVKAYLAAQVKHGVSAVQLFDSWVGVLSARDYSKYVLPYSRSILGSVSSVPTIHFCADSSALLEDFHRTSARILSVDWRVPIGEVWKRCGKSTGAQGNLDPVLASAGGKEMLSQVDGILRLAEGHRGHVFSLGHGVLRDTNPENLRAVVRRVHNTTRRRR